MSPLDPSLARAIILATGWRGNDMQRCCAAFLMILLQAHEADAGLLPAEVCTNSQTNEVDVHLAGMACASLRAQGLIIGVGRVKSSSPLANGRRVNSWRLVSHDKARSWLARHNYSSTETEQLSLAIA